MQVQPSVDLKPFVKHYLFLEKRMEAGTLLRLFSDGHTGLVFHFGNACLRHETQPLPVAFLYGQLDHFREIYCEDALRLCIVVFQPHAIPAWLKIPANELAGEILDASLCHRRIPEIAERIHDQPIPATIGIIEDHLRKIFTVSPTDYAAASYATARIHRQHGNITVAALGTEMSMHERTLQRLFAEHIGISPKQYASVIRTQFFLKNLRQPGTVESLAGMAADSGFYDQSHLTRNLKKIAGITPLAYLQNPNRLAANFLQVV